MSDEEVHAAENTGHKQVQHLLHLFGGGRRQELYEAVSATQMVVFWSGYSATTPDPVPGNDPLKQPGGYMYLNGSFFRKHIFGIQNAVVPRTKRVKATWQFGMIGMNTAQLAPS